MSDYAPVLLSGGAASAGDAESQQALAGLEEQEVGSRWRRTGLRALLVSLVGCCLLAATESLRNRSSESSQELSPVLVPGLPAVTVLVDSEGFPTAQEVYAKATQSLDAGTRDDGEWGIPEVPGWDAVLAQSSDEELGSGPVDELLESDWHPPGTNCLGSCKNAAGWCSWCGSGGACCQLGSKRDPAECRGFGGKSGHECVRIPAQANAQCGGQFWKGATSCVPGYHCVVVHPVYSQCRLAATSQHHCTEPYGTCAGWRNNAPWKTCCAAGHLCTSVSGKSQCLPSSLLHAGENCFWRCGKTSGDCSWCGQGNACCPKQPGSGPAECNGVQFLTSDAFQCVAPVGEVAVKHQGQSCLAQCGNAPGSCEWCGNGNACCRKGARDDPLECRGVHFSATDKDVCVAPVHEPKFDHKDQDCWSPCDGKSGYCSWCGEGLACCREGAQNDPSECLGVTKFSRSDAHVCVQPPTPALLGASAAAVTQNAQHREKDCWYACKGSGFCRWCGHGNACCREGAHNDPQECSSATNFSSTKHHVCVVVPPTVNKVSITSSSPKKVMYNGMEVGLGGKVRGVAGAGNHAAKAKEVGVDAVRTWSVEQSVGAMRAGSSVGLKVAAGIYLTTFKDKYEGEYCKLDNRWWQDELDKIIPNVTQHRNDPALLWWQVGNELELSISWAGGSECLYRRLEWVASHVKAADPNHPVGTAIAGFHKVKVGLMHTLCPSLDFIGLNVYGGDAYHLAAKLATAGWTRPYAVTEYGSAGAWMVPSTPWGSPVEPTSTQKAVEIGQIHTECLAEDSCIGTFAFMWGWKWEMTPTWFSTFNEWRAAGADEPITDMVHALQEVWTGKAPENPSPSITAVAVWDQNGPRPSNLGFTAQQGAVVRVSLSAVDLPKNDAEAWSDNEVVWVLTDDKPGEMAARASVVSGAHQVCGSDSKSNLVALVDTSKLQEGQAYRLYAFVRDSVHWEASQPDGCQNPVDGDSCDVSVLWAMSEGTNQHPNWYPGLSPASSYRDVQQFLFQTSGACPQPCRKRVNITEAQASIPFKICHDATPDEECGKLVASAMSTGIHRNPEKYPGLTAKSNFRQFQRHFQTISEGGCHAPCDECQDVSQDTECAQAIWNQMTKMTEPLTAPYSGTNMWSSFPELQAVLKRYKRSGCPQPCSLALSSHVQGQCPADR